MRVDAANPAIGATSTPATVEAGGTTPLTFVRNRIGSDSSQSESGDESSPSTGASKSSSAAPRATPSKMVTVYRGYNGPAESLEWAALSPYARKLVEGGESVANARKMARRNADAISKDPDQKRNALADHADDSGARVFPIASQGGTLGPSPFVSVTTDPQIADNFARRFKPASTTHTTLEFKIRESKLTSTDNSGESELVVKGGVNPRHMVHYKQETLDALTSGPVNQPTSTQP